MVWAQRQPTVGQSPRDSATTWLEIRAELHSLGSEAGQTGWIHGRMAIPNTINTQPPLHDSNGGDHIVWFLPPISVPPAMKTPPSPCYSTGTDHTANRQTVPQQLHRGCGQQRREAGWRLLLINFGPLQLLLVAQATGTADQLTRGIWRTGFCRAKCIAPGALTRRQFSILLDVPAAQACRAWPTPAGQLRQPWAYSATGAESGASRSAHFSRTASVLTRQTASGPLLQQLGVPDSSVAYRTGTSNACTTVYQAVEETSWTTITSQLCAWLALPAGLVDAGHFRFPSGEGMVRDRPSRPRRKCGLISARSLNSSCRTACGPPGMSEWQEFQRTTQYQSTSCHGRPAAQRRSALDACCGGLPAAVALGLSSDAESSGCGRPQCPGDMPDSRGMRWPSV